VEKKTKTLDRVGVPKQKNDDDLLNSTSAGNFQPYENQLSGLCPCVIALEGRAKGRQGKHAEKRRKTQRPGSGFIHIRLNKIVGDPAGRQHQASFVFHCTAKISAWAIGAHLSP